MAESFPTTFRCRQCDEEHPGPPLSWAYEEPDPWTALTPAQRRTKGGLSSDQCVIEPDHYFIRGSIEIPVLDGDGPFVWGVWVSLSETNFKRASARWNDPNRIEEPPYFGWLCNNLPAYPETVSLKTNLHTREVGVRPYVELEPTDHPLAVEQREGITMARVIEIAEIALHHNAALPTVQEGALKRTLRHLFGG